MSILFIFSLNHVESGIEVILEILNRSYHRVAKAEWLLEDCLFVMEKYHTWAKYHSSHAINSSPIEGEKISNYSDVEILKLVAEVESSFQLWISGIELTDEVFQTVEMAESILVIINTPHVELHKFPWESWELFSRFPKAGVGMGVRNKVGYENSLLFLLNRQVELRVIQNPVACGDSLLITWVRADDKHLNIDEEEYNLLKDGFLLEIFDLGKLRQQRSCIYGQRLVIITGHGYKYGVRFNRHHIVTIEQIGDLFNKKTKKFSELVFINTCESFLIGRHLAQFVFPMAIATTEKIPDKVSAFITKSLMRGLGKKQPPWLILRKIKEELKRRETTHSIQYIGSSFIPILYVDLDRLRNDTIKIVIPDKVFKGMMTMAFVTTISLVVITLDILLEIRVISEIAGIPTKITEAITEASTNFYVTHIQSYKAYINQDYKIEVSYPDNWQLQYNPDIITGDILRMLSPNNRDVVVYLNIQDFSKQFPNIQDLANQFLGLEGFGKRFIEESKISWNDFKLIEKKSVTLTNRQGYAVTFSTSQEGKKYKKISIFTLKDNKVYIMTYSAPEKLFAKDEFMANKISNSLKLLD